MKFSATGHWGNLVTCYLEQISSLPRKRASTTWSECLRLPLFPSRLVHVYLNDGYIFLSVWPCNRISLIVGVRMTATRTSPSAIRS